MIMNLKDAQKYEKIDRELVMRGKPQVYRVNIQREVRYYASVGSVLHVLAHDWTLEELDKRLWLRDSKNKPLKRKKSKK